MSEDPGGEALFWHGIDLFNNKQFYDCHEVLEDFWKTEPEPDRQLTQGIIQVAVAYYHALRGNRPGAIKLLNRGLPRIKPFLPSHKGLLLSDFYAQVNRDLSSLTSDCLPETLMIPAIPIAQL